MYVLYNMGGQRDSTFTRRGPARPDRDRTVRFIAIDTVNLDQTGNSRGFAASSRSPFRLVGDLPSSITPSIRRAATALGALGIGATLLEPVLVQFGAHVGLAGHEHFYERLVPQRGVLYFTSGVGGALIDDTAPTTPDGLRIRRGHALPADGSLWRRPVLSGDQPHGTDDRLRDGSSA